MAGSERAASRLLWERRSIMLPRRSVAPFLLLAVGGGLSVAAGSQPPTLAPPYQGPLEIHLLPHSHQDGGLSTRLVEQQPI